MSVGNHSIVAGPVGQRFRGSLAVAKMNWKVVIATLVLFAEISVISFCFDARTLDKSIALPASAALAPVSSPGTAAEESPESSVLITILSNAGLLERGVLIAALFTVLLCRRALADALGQASSAPASRLVVTRSALHLAIYLAFCGLTFAIFAQDFAHSSWKGAAFGGWFVLGALSVISLVAVVLPPVHWGLLARRCSLPALAGAVVGLASVRAGQIATGFWPKVATLTLNLVYMIVRQLETHVVYRPAEFVVGTESFFVSIAPVCSGYEGVGLAIIFIGAYLLVLRARFRFPRALLLIAVGAATVWVVNVLRIAALIEIGTRISPAVAVGGFHSQAGWIGFAAVSLGIVYIANRFDFFKRSLSVDTSEVGRSAPSDEQVYLTPLLAIIGVSMVTGAMSTGDVDHLYALRVTAVAIPFWIYRHEYTAMRWSVSGASIAIGIAVYILWTSRSLLSTTFSGMPVVVSPGATSAVSTLWIVGRSIGSVVTVPFAEELAFRGFLPRRLVSAHVSSITAKDWTWYSVGLSSLAFGVLHHHWIEGTLAGLLYALAYRRRESIGDAVAAHATTNAILCAQAVISGDWSIIS